MAYDVQNFQQEVIQKSFEKPVLVDFWAEWCGPCKILGPVLEKLAEKHNDKWVLAKVNTEVHQELAMQYGIRGIPNVKLFIDGQVTDEFTGAMPEAAIEQWLQKAIPSKFAQHVAQAADLLQRGDIQKSQEILESVLAAEPGNLAAKAMLARSLAFSNPQKAVELAQDLEGTEHYNLSEALNEIAYLYDRAENPDKLPEAPVKSQYLQAIADLKQLDFEKALKTFIEIIIEDRYYDDDGARKACIAIFKYLGDSSELTRDYRTRLSRAMY